MKVEIGKEWCIRMAELEEDAEIGAGRLAVDPVFDGEAVPVEVSDEDGSNVAFGRFVRLMRRRLGLSLEKLAVCRRCRYGRSSRDRERSTS